MILNPNKYINEVVAGIFEVPPDLAGPQQKWAKDSVVRLGLNVKVLSVGLGAMIGSIGFVEAGFETPARAIAYSSIPFIGGAMINSFRSIRDFENALSNQEPPEEPPFERDRSYRKSMVNAV